MLGMKRNITVPEFAVRYRLSGRKGWYNVNRKVTLLTLNEAMAGGIPPWSRMNKTQRALEFFFSVPATDEAEAKRNSEILKESWQLALGNEIEVKLVSITLKNNGGPEGLPALREMRLIGPEAGASIHMKTAPLHCFTYPQQIEMKHKFVRATCRRIRVAIQKRYLEMAVKYTKHGTDSLADVGRSALLPKWAVWNGEAINTLDTVEAPDIWRLHYRNKIELTVENTWIENPDVDSGWEKDQSSVVVGMVQRVVKGGDEWKVIVAAIDGLCHIPQVMQEFARAVRDWIAENVGTYRVFDRRTARRKKGPVELTLEGVWRSIQVRAAFDDETKGEAGGGRLLISFLIAPSVGELSDKASEFLGFIRNRWDGWLLPHSPGWSVEAIAVLTSDRCNDCFDSTCKIFSVSGPVDEGGAPKILQVFMDLSFCLTPMAFFQTNIGATKKLYSGIVATALTEVPEENILLLDICCGTGTIGQVTLRDLPESTRLVGVDIVQDAIDGARIAAERHFGAEGNKRIRYECGAAEDVLPSILKEEFATNSFEKVICIVDPPRAGLHRNVITALRTNRLIDRIIYVSCQADTFERDAQQLCAIADANAEKYEGYVMPFRPVSIQGYDMFPNTTQLELLAVFERLGEGDFVEWDATGKAKES